MTTKILDQGLTHESVFPFINQQRPFSLAMFLLFGPLWSGAMRVMNVK